MNNFHNPYLIQVAPVTYGCTRRCIWCGIRSVPIDTKPIYLKRDLAYKISEEVGEWLEKVRIEFGLLGEPFMNRHLLDIVSYFHNNIKNPWIIAYTNGDLLDHDKVLEFFKSGGNLLIIDPYEESGYRRFVYMIEENKSELERLKVKVIFYDSEKHNFRHHDHHGRNRKFLVINDTLRSPRGTITWHTMGGNVDIGLVKKHGIYMDLEMKPNKYCTNPFRYFTLRSDGTVLICCNDWRGDCIIAKYPEDGTLREIWYSDPFMAVRAILRYRRSIPPCKYCSYHGGYRIGLEPKIQFNSPEEFLANHQEKYRHLKLPNARNWNCIKTKTIRDVVR